MNQEIKEFHLFAGIGGGIYGGELLGHQCCAGVRKYRIQEVIKNSPIEKWIS